MKGPHVWTVSEIQRLPEFGNEHGWFYGLVRDEEQTWFAEILPGMGYVWLTARDFCSVWTLRRLISDVFRYRPERYRSR